MGIISPRVAVNNSHRDLVVIVLVDFVICNSSPASSPLFIWKLFQVFCSNTCGRSVYPASSMCNTSVIQYKHSIIGNRIPHPGMGVRMLERSCPFERSLGNPCDRSGPVPGRLICMTQGQEVVMTGLVTIVGIVVALVSMCTTAGRDFVPPWEAHNRAVYEAQAARAQFLRNGFFAITKSMKDHICCQMRKWHIRLCPLCC